MPQRIAAAVCVSAICLASGRLNELSAKTQPKADLESILQGQIDAVVAHFRPQYPDLALSAAWRDSVNDVAVASGTVSGRPITTTDTFLYGSGTKPITATAVMQLIDAGKLNATDKVAMIVDPYLEAHGKPSLADFFGEAVSNATVLEVIRMGAGIRDFEDSFDFDTWVLGNGSKFWDYPYDAMRFAVSHDNTKGGSPLICNPGNCTAYSSTSYEVAGLVLVATLAPSVAWYDFDLGSAVFSNRSKYPTMHFPPMGNGTAKLSQYLTVPGTSFASTWPKTTIYDQSPSILGWTCGNMIASPRDVAKFSFYTLDNKTAHNSADTLISDAARSQITSFQRLSKGWMAGRLKYGAGMMQFSYAGLPVLGHEGDTYGFLSTQAYVPTLGGSFSVASNVDVDLPMETMVCYLLQVVMQQTGGSNSTAHCPPLSVPDVKILV
jgi:hypothetical protein